MLGFKRTPAPLPPDYGPALAEIHAAIERLSTEQDHERQMIHQIGAEVEAVCTRLTDLSASLDDQLEIGGLAAAAHASELDRIQTRLARIEATLQRFDLWAADRIEGWPVAGGD